MLLAAVCYKTGTKIKLPTTCGAPRAAAAAAETILFFYTRAARAFACVASRCGRVPAPCCCLCRVVCVLTSTVACLLCCTGCAFGFSPACSPPCSDLKGAFDELGTSLEDMVDICGSGIFPSDVIDVR